MIKDKFYVEVVLGNPGKSVGTSLKLSLKQIQKEIGILEEKLLNFEKQVHQDLLTSLKTIRGICEKTAIMLVVLTGGFERFSSPGELFNYTGFTSIIRESKRIKKYYFFNNT
ncbi:transposase [Bizionia arctica]|uniref:Transposase IS116/IS110/IS902 C-terminal domain-containing protein n=1 Tax=Bizionia arctica TaxID=1495645 RepID=A0A917GNJ8_9FLAO|nr:transposase [Bizionia arctica]GGG51939.1 hypothetical protein GCM10010976_23870 [Bizionia arctica]